MKPIRRLVGMNGWLTVGAPIFVFVCVFLLFPTAHSSRRKAPELSEGEMIDLRGGMAALKGVDLAALKNSLPPPIRSAKRLIIVTSGWETCPGCVTFPYDRNDTGVPGVWITYRTPPRYKPEKGVTVLGRESVRGIPDEAYNAPVGAILVDFDEKTVTPSPGSYATWSSYLDALQKYEPCCKEQL